MTAASLGIDIGTSASKAVLAGPDGEILAQAEVERGNPVTQTVRPDPSVRAAYDQAYARYRDPARLIEPVSHALAATQQAHAPAAGDPVARGLLGGGL